ncbi:MAG: C10 family peptidase [Bacteroidales bacterium]|nr:C10 family peptidase [Bacteroidales bacterium]
MKKSTKMLMLLALAGSATAMATPVSQERAAQVAQMYVSQQYTAPAGLSVKSVETFNDQLYLVNFAPTGWALVSSDDAAEPIIGYSTESNITPKQMPENMTYMLGEVTKSVKLAVNQGQVDKTWARIESGSSMLSRASEPVEPLITVKWNQGSPYNAYCPGTGNNKAVVGCVAVAMSQAMSVQQYPQSPSGFYEYTCDYGYISIDYDKEEPYNWSDILSGANNYDEVARLLYHAGVSVSMSYGTDGSGIPSNQVYRITNALKDTFGYADDVNYYWRDSYSGNWQQLLLNELYAGRALIYNAIDSQGGYGHSFNIDGYDGSLYHLNWGWGGTGNSYFSINALSDAAMGMNYDSKHVVVTGVGAPNSALRGVALSDQYVETDHAAGSAFCALLVNGELASLGDFTVTITGEYDDMTGEYKEVPFEYNNGLLYTTRALTTADNDTYVRCVVVDNASGTKITQGFTITVEAPQLLEHRVALTYDRNTSVFTLKLKFGTKYTVKNAQGTTIVSGEVSSDPYVEFNRSQLTSGDNTIELSNGSQSKTVKIKL